MVFITNSAAFILVPMILKCDDLLKLYHQCSQFKNPTRHPMFCQDPNVDHYIMNWATMC